MEYAIGSRSTGVIDLIRNLPDVSRRGGEVVAAMGRLVFPGTMLLVLAIATLAAGSRLPTDGQYTSTWHTTKIARMAEHENGEVEPLQMEDVRPDRRNAILQPRTYSPAPNLPNLIGAFPQDALRAPPIA